MRVTLVVLTEQKGDIAQGHRRAKTGEKIEISSGAARLQQQQWQQQQWELIPFSTECTKLAKRFRYSVRGTRGGLDEYVYHVFQELHVYYGIHTYPLFVDGFKTGHKKILITVATTHERESATQEMDSFLTPEVVPEVTTVLN